MDDDFEITLINNAEKEEETQPTNQPTIQNQSDGGMMYEGNNEPATIVITKETLQDEPKAAEDMAQITKTIKKPKEGTQLDKFKRRLIRAIARFLRNNQAPTEEIWEELKKQTGCDCKLLWDRMRALTMKKLRRLFTSEDTVSNITQIAQLTVTDWLMFDLVLVHEKLDVIGQELTEEEVEVKVSPKILEDLFATVVIFDLEHLQGDELTKAWFEATKDYNGTERQCSPMLLQKRWYQMKAKVREKFYQFWFSYRGDQRQLAAANEFKPTDLELEIVKHFKYITTKPLPTWEELIEQKKVALPEDFERLQLAKRKIFRIETGPDLEVIEPHVETIDLERDSDSEESRDSASLCVSKENENVKVKIEKVNEISDDDDDVHVLESVHIPVPAGLETNTGIEAESELGNTTNGTMVDEQINPISNHINNEENISVFDDDLNSIRFKQLPNDTTVRNKKNAINAQDIGIPERQVTGDESDDDVEIVMPSIVASTSISNNAKGNSLPFKISNESSAAILTEEPADDAVNNEITCILENVAENNSAKEIFNILPSTRFRDKTIPMSDNTEHLDTLVKNIMDTTVINNNFVTNAQNIGFVKHANIDNADKAMPTIIASTSIANTENDFDLVMPKITNISSAAIRSQELVVSDINNDGILKNVAENISNKAFNVQSSTLSVNKRFPAIDHIKNQDTLVNDIDEGKNSRYKEIGAHVKQKKNSMKLDDCNDLPKDILLDGIILEDDGIEYFEEDDNVREIDSKLLNTEKTADSDCDNTPTIDLKLLLTPIVYTKKLDDMDVFRFIDYNAVKDQRVIENADIESKPVDRNSVKMEEISQERSLDDDVFSDTGSEYQSEDEFGIETINPSSWLLNKLKKLSYNPIQLCKNPDFNTRLKRLSAGFFSSERNRFLLKECKPLTIDLHKSFEAKLYNNTLYLSGTKSIEQKTDGLLENAIRKSVHPTAIPMDNLINNVRYDISRPATPSDNSLATQFSSHSATLDSHPAERKRVINLPDIAQIRRLNEKLLTAEVTPIQISKNNKPPVNIVSMDQNLETIGTVQNNTSDIMNEDSNIASTCIRDKNNETSNIFNKHNLTSDDPYDSSHSKEIYRSVSTLKESGDISDVIIPSYNNLINTTDKTQELTSNCYKAIKGNILNRFRNQVAKNPKKGMRSNYVELSWNPKPKAVFAPEDALLTSDTVDKILNICRGDVDILRKTRKPQSKHNKVLRVKALNQKWRENQKSTSNKKTKKKEVSETPHDEVSFVSQQNITKYIQNQKTNQKTRSEKNITKHTYCCWAREKVVKLELKKRLLKKHDCPPPMCNCCCRQELVDKMFQIRLEIAKRSEPEKEQPTQPVKITVSSAQSVYKSPTQIPRSLISTEMPQNNSKISAQISYKVSVGINTDFDMDFENKFAANLAELSSSTNLFNKDYDSASSFKVTCAPNLSQAYCQTQPLSLVHLNKNTVVLKKPIILKKKNLSFSFQESNLSNAIPLKKTIDSGDSEKSNPIISHNQSDLNNVIPKKNVAIPNKNNAVFSFTESNLRTKKRTLIGDKINPTCRHQDDPNSMISKIQPRIAPKNPFLTDPALLARDASIILEERAEKSDKVLFFANDGTKTASLSPICLGKNKILLCSFEQPHMKTNDITPLDPKYVGVSNNDNSQNTAPLVLLPDGVRIVLLPNKELALSIDPGVELDSNQLAYLPTLMASIQRQLLDTGAVENFANSLIDPLNIQNNSNNQNNTTLNNHCNESETRLDAKNPIDNANLNDTEMKLSCSEQSRDYSDDNMETQLINMEKKIDVEFPNKETSDCVLDNSNEINVSDLKDNNDLNKKTILSDLMEMSGISADDTHITNNGSPNKQRPELCSTPKIGIKSKIINHHNEKYMNNPLFQNSAVQTALSRCPELCIVYTYREMKYASENKAQFFKMDIETGIITPIHLVIKKTLQKKNSQEINQSVIDLTDDLEEDEIINIEEQDVNTFEAGSASKKECAVPVKLFSSIQHPSTTRRGKSLLVQSVMSKDKRRLIIKQKNVIRVIQVKNKRKKPMETVITSIDLDSDNEQKEKTTQDDDSDSDDEPLAFKAKRMKESFEPKELTEPSNVITEKSDLKEANMSTFEVNNQNIGMVIDNEIEVSETAAVDSLSEDSPNNEISDEISAPLNDESIEMEPLHFDDTAPESSDEDCILGV